MTGKVINLNSIQPASAAIAAATRTVPGIPCEAEGPVFREPWEAQAFALAVTLQERGLFTWGEWAGLLGEEIRKAKAAGDEDTGATYYQHWLAALERIVTLKGATHEDALSHAETAWGRAAERTPHGVPIELRPEDYAR